MSPSATDETHQTVVEVKCEPDFHVSDESCSTSFEQNIPNMDDTLGNEPVTSPDHKKGKPQKCKKCNFTCDNKLEFWSHVRGHIPPSKLLTCPTCNFVTEFKHHLEYHLKNHAGIKPFKCDQCTYTCNNKSMLNSHKKSHSNIYQYRCLDCNYASKYCHQLKQHLRRYTHKPAMVLNPDGTPNPLPIIDVYGTKRGPKMKPLEPLHSTEPAPMPMPQVPVLPFPLTLPSIMIPVMQQYLLTLQRLNMAGEAPYHFQPNQTLIPEGAANYYSGDSEYHDSRSSDICEETYDGVLDLRKPEKKRECDGSDGNNNNDEIKKDRSS